MSIRRLNQFDPFGWFLILSGVVIIVLALWSASDSQQEYMAIKTQNIMIKQVDKWQIQYNIDESELPEVMRNKIPELWYIKK